MWTLLKLTAPATELSSGTMNKFISVGNGCLKRNSVDFIEVANTTFQSEKEHRLHMNSATPTMFPLLSSRKMSVLSIGTDVDLKYVSHT